MHPNVIAPFGIVLVATRICILSDVYRFRPKSALQRPVRGQSVVRVRARVATVHQDKESADALGNSQPMKL